MATRDHSFAADFCCILFSAYKCCVSLTVALRFSFARPEGSLGEAPLAELVGRRTMTAKQRAMPCMRCAHGTRMGTRMTGARFNKYRMFLNGGQHVCLLSLIPCAGKGDRGW